MKGDLIMKTKNYSKKKKEKSLKGFSLVEVIIAILIFAIGSSLLVSAGVSILNNIRESRNIVRKVNYETGIVAYGPKIPDTSDENGAYFGQIDAYTGLTELHISSSNISVPSGYSTIDVSAYEALPDSTSTYTTKASYNLKYFRPVS